MQIRMGGKPTSWPCTVGFVLSVLGIPMMAMVKLMAGQNLKWLSTAVIIASVVFFVNYRRLAKFDLEPFNFEMWTIVIYSACTLVLALVSGKNWMEPGFGFTFQMCYFLQVLILWNNVDRFDTNKTLRTFFWVSGIVAVIALYFVLVNKNLTGSYQFQGLGEAEEGSIIGRDSIGGIGGFCVVGAVSYNKGTRLESIVRIFFLTCALGNVFLSTRRTSLVGVALLFIVYLRNERGNALKQGRDRAFLTLCAVLAVVIAVVVVWLISPDVQEIVQKSWDALIKGTNTFTGRGGKDMAAEQRRSKLEYYSRQFWTNSSVSQFVFGHGYGAMWMDLPYLEALWEMGLTGGIVFFLIQFVFSVKYLFFYKARTPVTKFAQYLMSVNFIAEFISGVPYGVFFNLTFLIMAVTAEKRWFAKKGIQQRRQVQSANPPINSIPVRE